MSNTIDLSSQALDHESFRKKFAEQNFSNVQVLNLKGNGLTAEDVNFMIGFKPDVFKTLQTLMLSNNKLGDDGCIALLEGIQKIGAPSLVKLELGFNYITSKGCISLAVAIAQGSLPSLRELVLRYNNVGEEAAMVLAKVLKSASNLYLDVLDLTGNTIGDNGAIAICQVLSSIHGAAFYPVATVKKLILWSVGITDKSADAICTMLRSNNTLEVLELSSNTLTQPSLEKIFTTIDKENFGLLDIGVVGNHAKDRYIFNKFKDLLQKRKQAREYMNPQQIESLKQQFLMAQTQKQQIPEYKPQFITPAATAIPVLSPIPTPTPAPVASGSASGSSTSNGNSLDLYLSTSSHQSSNLNASVSSSLQQSLNLPVQATSSTVPAPNLATLMSSIQGWESFRKAKEELERQRKEFEDYKFNVEKDLSHQKEELDKRVRMEVENVLRVLQDKGLVDKKVKINVKVSGNPYVQ